MPAPSPRNKILPARGAYSALVANIASILDGEICYAIDQDQYYQKEGSVLVAVGATKAQGALADSAVQPGDNVSDLINDAGYITLADVPADVVSSVNGQTGAVVLDADDIDDTSTAHKFTTQADINKLAGIEAGAEVNTVDSVAGKTGTVALVKGDVGLGSVDNTSDANKPISTATQSALDAKADLVGGVIPNSQLPSLAISEYLGTVANQAGLLALSGQRGDWAIRTDTGSTWVIATDGGSNLSDWTELATPADAVTSVNGFTGAVVLGPADVGAATAAQGALADSATQPGDNVSTLTNDAGYITSAGAPVQSVNGQTGAVVLDTDDVAEGAVNLYSQWDTATGGINYASGNVGIGTSSPSTAKLVVGSSSSYLNDAGVAVLKPHELGLENGYFAYSDVNYSGNTSYETAGFKSDGPNAKTSAFLATTGAGADGLGGTVKASIYHNGGSYFAGNVGIGTDSPAGQLHVASTGTTRVFVEGSDGKSEIRASNGNLSFFCNQDANPNGLDTTVFYRNGANESMRIDSDGNLGIGTSSPPSRLTVQDNLQSTPTSTWNTGSQFIVGDNAVQLAFGRSGSSPFPLWMQGRASNNATRAILINPVGGNVGIGTSSPASALDVYKSSDGEYFRCGSSNINRQLVFSSSNTQFDGDTHTINAGSSVGRLILATADTDRIHIDQNGNVGIGTSSPAVNFVVSNSGAEGFEVGPTINSRVTLTAYNRSTSAFEPMQIRSDLLILASKNGAEAMRIDSNGRVGIGTSSPTKIIEIAGNNGVQTVKYGDGTTGGYFVSQTDVDRGSADAAIHVHDFRWNGNAVAKIKVLTGDDTVNKDNGYFTFETSSGAGLSESMRINPSGNLGIGTTSPGARLHLASTGGVGLRFEAGGAATDEKTIQLTQNSNGAFVIQGLNESGGGGGGYWQINRSGNNIQNLTTYRAGTERIKLDSWNSKITFSNALGYLGTTGDNALVFETNGSEVGRFSNTGSFGIGTSSPSSLLHTVGSRSYTGTVPDLDSYDVNFQSNTATVSIGSHNGIPTIQGQGSGTAYKLALNVTQGNVGIGTNSPDEKLHVDGNIQIADGGSIISNAGAVKISADPSQTQGASQINMIVDGTEVADFNNGGYLRFNKTGYVNAGVCTQTTTDGLNLGGGNTATNSGLNVALKGPDSTGNWGYLARWNTTNIYGYDKTSDYHIWSTGGSERMRLDSDGDVGIGTSNPGYRLSVNRTDTATILAGFTGGAAVAFLNVAASGTTSNAVRFGATGDSNVLWAGGAERMRIDSSGEVGIGTTSPDAKLHVLAGANSGILLEDISTSNAAPDIEVIGKRSDGNRSPNFGGKLLLAKNRTDAAINSGSALGTVLFGGNHTNGNTSNILYAASIGGISEGGFSNSADMPTGLAFYTGSTGSTSTVAGTNFGTERMRIDSSGNVGIGTNSPSSKLTVSATGDEAVLSLGRTDAAVSGILLVGSGNNANFITGGGTKDLFIATNNTERMRIDSSGNVGIGTTSPDVKLDVEGEVRASTGILFGTDTAAVNTLDDYEEGTYTPSFQNGSWTYTNQSGYYTKVGNTVTVWLSISWSSRPAGANLNINLPFTPATGVEQSGTITDNGKYNTGSADVQLGCGVADGNSTLTVVVQRDGVSRIAGTSSAFQLNSTFTASISYRV